MTQFYRVEQGTAVDSNLVSHHHHVQQLRRHAMDYAAQSMYRSIQDDMLVSPGGLFPDHSRPPYEQDTLEPDHLSYDLFSQNSFSTQKYRTNASSTSSLAHSAFNGDTAFAHHAFGEPTNSGYPATSHSSYDFIQPLQSYNTGSISPLTPVDPVNGLHSLPFNPTGKDYSLDPVIPPVGASAYLHEQIDDRLPHGTSNNGYYAPATAHTLQLASTLDRFPAHPTTVSNHLLQHHTPQSTEMMQVDPYGLEYQTNNSSPTDDSLSSSGLQPDVSAHIEPLAQMRLYPNDPPKDFNSLMQPYLEHYLRAPNRLALGERTVIVMTSRVAQKSYKTEKRFLCPPPTAILIGNAWWQNTSTPAEHDQRLSPPTVTISISGEAPPTQDAAVDWTNAVGKSIDVSDPPSGTTYIGHGMGKQLFISDADERRKKVEALVTVKAPAVGDEDEGAVIGTFPSRPIKVISKPSKKRQSAKNLELCINHGSIVSLFHRLRSQTVSTKYLCVSGSSSSFKGSDGQSMPGLEQRTKSASPSFVARTTAWDCFVIYIVDVNINVNADIQPAAPPQPHYPVPPPNAVPLSAQPIYYNQLVVLQCLTSGVVSPVLIIRKIDHQTTVVGGGMQDGAKPISNAYCALGEVCGDPVSQLHKVAFEVYEPKQQTPTPGTPGISSAFLSCISEKVNTTRPLVDRQWISTLAPPSPVSPIVTSSEYFASAPSSPILPEDPVSNDGGRVRKRRSASNASIQKTVGKGKRRPSSASSTASGSRQALPSDGLSASSGALWSVDVGEASCWTIVNVDQVRYNFYIPPVKSLYPIPRSPVTPFPAIVKYLPPDRASEVPKCSSSSRMKPQHPQASKLLTVYGENFPKDDSMHVYFGSEPSPFIEVRCTEVLACMPPEAQTAKHRPMLLVRSDGVIFPSSTTYP